MKQGHYYGDYAVAVKGLLSGVIDITGKEIVPCKYDDISCIDTLFASGYQSVVKDDKFGYVDLNGHITAELIQKQSYRRAGTNPFDTDSAGGGQVDIVSAAVGKLPGHYMDAALSPVDGCPLIAAKNVDGQSGVLNLQGNAVVPFSADYDSVYDLLISYDGTIVIGDHGDGSYTIYRLKDSER